MKRINLLRSMIYILAGFIALGFPIAAWLTGAEFMTILLYSLGILLLLMMIWLMDMVHQSYTDKLLLDLSELVESIIDKREDNVFSDVEDTLLSKLQNQVIKLSRILKAQNHTINKEKNEIKSLVSDISHQLKTPVASIKMFGDLLKESDLNEQQQKEYLQMLEKSLDKLVFLTDSMIKMSRLESGIIRLNLQSNCLNDIVLQAVKQVYHKAMKKNIEISFMETDSTKLTIDKNWTAESIFNILDNAVKYSPNGSKVTITIIKYEFFARLDIADNGEGIPEEEQAKIFKRFYRGQGTADIEGVGIGLYLSQKIITDQGGYMKVQSDKNGSTFSIFLPLNER